MNDVKVVADAVRAAVRFGEPDAWYYYLSHPEQLRRIGDVYTFAEREAAESTWRVRQSLAGRKPVAGAFL